MKIRWVWVTKDGEPMWDIEHDKGISLEVAKQSEDDISAMRKKRPYGWFLASYFG